MSWLWGFLLLLAIAILIRYGAKKLVPVLMPPSRIKTVLVALIGAFVGSLAFRLCHLGDVAVVAEINPIGAILGAAVFLLLFGAYPFIKVFFGRI